MPTNTLPQNSQSAPPTGEPSVTLDPDIVNVTKAIRDNEGGSNFQQVGQSGEFGAYQFMPGTWGKVATSVGVNTPLQQASPEEQNYVAYHYVKSLKDQGYNVGEIASMWNHGSPDPSGAVGVNSSGVSYNTPQYVDNVYNSYKKYKNAAGAQPDSPTAGLPTYGATFPYQSGDNGIVAGAKAIGNLPSSVYGFGKGIADMVFHPINTIENLGGVAIGGLEELTGIPSSGQTQTFDQFAQALKDRYGSVNSLANTAVNDPFGFGADIASLLAGGAGLVGKGAELGELGSRAVQVATRPAEGALARLAAPFAGSVDTGVTGAAERLGMNAGDLPATAVSNSPVVGAVEALAAKSVGGQSIVERAASAADKLAGIADAAVSAAGGAEDLASAGQMLGEGLNKFVSEFKTTVSGLYDKFQNAVGDKLARTSNSIDAINAILDRKSAIGDTEGTPFFEGRLKALENAKKPPTFSVLKQMRTDVGARIANKFGDPFVKANIAQMKQLYGALTDDMYATMKATRGAKAKGIVSDYENANQVYQQGRQSIESNMVRQIQRFAQNHQWDKIIPALLRPSASITDIKNVMAMTGEAGTAQIRTSLLKTLFDGAKNEKGDFKPSFLNSQIEKNATKYKSILTPEQFQGLNDVATVAKSLGKLTRITGGSQTAFLLEHLAQGGLVWWGAVDLLSGNIVGAVQKIGAAIGTYGASRFVSSEEGQRLLTTGLKNQAIGQTALAEANREGLQPPSLTQSSASDTIAGQATDATKENGGVTVDTKTGESPTSGFAFAPDKSTERVVPLAEFSQEHTAQFMQDHAEALDKPDNYLGVWVDGDKVYLDVSTVLPDKAEAMAAASKADQLAVFDLSTGQTHNVADYGKEIGGNNIDKGQDAGGGASGGAAENGAGSAAAGQTSSSGGDAAANLSEEHQAISDKADTYFEANKEKLIQQYATEHGKVSNTDLARPLFKGHGYDGTNSMAVQKAAKKISTAVWQKNLKDGEGDSAVIYAGGSGVGKSSTLAKLDPEALKNAAAIWDGNSDSLPSMRLRVDQAIEAGKVVEVKYIYRPMQKAFEGMVARMLGNAKEEGRLVPISELVANHVGSYNAVKEALADPKLQALMKEGKLSISMFDNSGTPAEISKMSMEKFDKITYNTEAIQERLRSMNKRLYEDGIISQKQYEAINK